MRHEASQSGTRSSVESIVQDLLRVGQELLTQFADGATPESAVLEEALGRRSQLLEELQSQWKGLRTKNPAMAERLELTQLKQVREQDVCLRENLHSRMQEMRGTLDGIADSRGKLAQYRGAHARGGRTTQARYFDQRS